LPPAAGLKLLKKFPPDPLPNFLLCRKIFVSELLMRLTIHVLSNFFKVLQ
jgi:hypothetical protein